MNEFTITVALCTRVNRKVFNDKDICDYFLEQLDLVARQEDVVIQNVYFKLGYLIIISCDIPIGLHPDKLLRRIKGATSANIRSNFSALSKMPSLWKKKSWWTAGTYYPDMLPDILEQLE